MNKQSVYQLTLIQLLALMLTGLLGMATPTPSFAFDAPWDQGHKTTDDEDPGPPGPCEGPQCDCRTQKSPVYVPTGHFIWRDLDIELKGRPEIKVKRAYNSHDPRTGLFGNAWVSNCDSALFKVIKSELNGGVTTQQTDYVLRMENGKRYIFKQQDDGTIVPPEGRFEGVTVEADGNLSLKNPDGSAYLYNAFGQILRKTDSDGNSVDYLRNEQGRLTKITDNTNRYLDLTYDSSGLVSSVSDQNGESWQYNYDANGNLTNLTDPSGKARNYEYQAYTPTGDSHIYYQLTKITDESGIPIIQVSYSDERVATYTKGETTYTYTHDSRTNTVTKIDSTGNQWIFTYNENQQISMETGPEGQSKDYEYDNNGRETRVIDEAGKAWSYRYDGQGRRLSATDPDGSETKWEYASPFPWPTKRIYPDGKIINIEYDQKGNPVKITDPQGGLTQFKWNERGDLISRTEPQGERSDMEYNQEGLLVKYKTTPNIEVDFTYHQDGTISASDNSGNTVNFDAEEDYDPLYRLYQYTYGPDDDRLLISFNFRHGMRQALGLHYIQENQFEASSAGDISSFLRMNYVKNDLSSRARPPLPFGGICFFFPKLCTGSPPGEGMDPPGDCEQGEYLKLTLRKDTACGKPFCKGLTECDEKLIQGHRNAWECQNARWMVMVLCFKGGDTRHINELNETTNGLERCGKKIIDLCNACPFTSGG